MFTVNFFLSVLVLLVSGIVFYALLYGTVLHYIKSYIRNEGLAIEEEVKSGVKQDFWSLIGLGFLVTLMISFGIMFCIVPGIYLGVTLATTYAILVFEKREVSDTISYSFQLIKDEFWNTFATLIVIFVLYYVIIIVFQIPQYIYFFARTFALNQEISSDPSSMFDWVYIALNSLAMVAQYLSYPLIVISTVFIYFNLNEKKNFTGTMEAIDAIGNGE